MLLPRTTQSQSHWNRKYQCLVKVHFKVIVGLITLAFLNIFSLVLKVVPTELQLALVDDFGIVKWNSLLFVHGYWGLDKRRLRWRSELCKL